MAAITPNTTGADIQNIINLALCKSVLNREKLEGKTPFPSYQNFRTVLGELRKGPHKFRGNQIDQNQMKNAALYESSKAVLALFYGGKLENAGFEGG